MTSDRNPPQIFDRELLRKRRVRASKTLHKASFLHERAMADLVDRLETTMRDFDRAIFYGAGTLVDMLTPACGVRHILSADLTSRRTSPAHDGLICDEERWPFAPASFDLVVSLLTLHHTNDLIGALAQIRASLKPDGLFVGVLFGEETLRSLREALYAAEIETSDGVSARVIPFASVRDLGGALQRAGFAMPVTDIDAVRINYQEPARLFSDLRAMGETNILKSKAAPMTRTMFSKTNQILQEQSSDMRFDLVYLTGWAPASTQPKPLRPGSAKHSLAEAVKKQ